MAAGVAGRLRWAINSSRWEPTGGVDGPEFRFLLGLIREDTDRNQVLKFHFDADKKRALLSRLLARKACATVLGFSNFDAIEIARTKGRKPFLKSPRPPDDCQELVNFNFNVSHEGDWVVLASEPMCVCGVDVAAPRDTRGRINIHQDFRDQLSADEWADVAREAARAPTRPGEDPEYEAFQRRWSCKEAFVKARGDGLGFEPLSRAAFTFSPLQREGVSTDVAGDRFLACVRVDGREAPRWRFFQHRLGESHWVTVARGPTEDVVDAHGIFAGTLRRASAEFSEDGWRMELLADSPPFQEISVADLVPADSFPGFLETDPKDVAPRLHAHEDEAHPATRGQELQQADESEMKAGASNPEIANGTSQT